MGCKLLVALQLEDVHHFIEGCAGERTRGFEPPATFGTTKAPKAPLFNPHQLPAHGRLCSTKIVCLFVKSITFLPSSTVPGMHGIEIASSWSGQRESWLGGPLDGAPDDCRLDYFLSVPATQTSNHASAATIIRVKSQQISVQCMQRILLILVALYNVWGGAAIVRSGIDS
jgi:hypothetical protein